MGEGVTKRSKTERRARGQQLDRERGKPQGRLIAVGGTIVICNSNQHTNTRAAQNVADVNDVAPGYFCIYCQENTVIHHQRTGCSVSLVQSSIMKRAAAALVVVYVTVRPAHHDLTMQQH